MNYLTKLFKFLARTDVFFVVLLWLIILLTAGTISQKYIGLYAAQERYFYSWILWLGDAFPMPGGASTIAFITIGLTIKLILQDWSWRKTGTIVAHAGSILLLGGGFITMQFGMEGNMVILEGDSRNFISDYHDLELVLLPENNQIPVAQLKDFELEKEAVLDLPGGAKIILNSFCRNCELVRLPKARENEDSRGMITNFELKNTPLKLEDEENLGGITFTVFGANNEGGFYGIFEDMPIVQHLKIEDKNYTIQLRRKQTLLPFSVHLTAFEKQVHPGTSMAKSYQSNLIIRDNGVEWPAVIKMNQPLRYRGFTFYQASFVDGKNAQTSVLAVVKNVGRTLPYIASVIMCIGLLIQLFKRLPALFRKTGMWLILGLCMAGNARANENFDMDNFAQIPVLHEGRIKPLDTFARSWLTNIYGKDKLPNMNADEWLAEMIFSPAEAYSRKVFNIANPEALNALGLVNIEGHKYSFTEVFMSIKSNLEVINNLAKMEESQLTKTQKQLVNLYHKTLWYFDISRAVSLILPEFIVPNKELAKQLNLPINLPFTYLEMMQQKGRYLATMEKIVSSKKDILNEDEKTLFALGKTLQIISRDSSNRVFKIIPPQWQIDGDEWFSAWGVMQDGGGSPSTAEYFKAWQKMALTWQKTDSIGWNSSTLKARNMAVEMAGSFVEGGSLKLEIFYNKMQLFKISLWLYISSFILLMFAGLCLRKYLLKISLATLATAGVMHVVGLGLRMVIMQRPPVTTLYESIIFVGLITTIFALVIEWRRRDNLGLLLGSVLGAVLQFLGMKYAAEGDTMGMLVAVLDTNFWLATHVVTITIGYGCCFVAGLIGHIYLMQRWIAPNEIRLNDLHKTMLGVALVALLFSALGTILGGIWADQSWGRFWGWDPKENGALLIVLWLIFLLHGRVAKTLNSLTFAVGIVLTNVTVALAWFGVNLLNVGLHSYGFTGDIAINLFAFCGLEVVFAVTLFSLIKIKETKR